MYTLGSPHQESSPSVVNSIKFAKLSASQTILYTDEPYDKVLNQKNLCILPLLIIVAAPGTSTVSFLYILSL